MAPPRYRTRYIYGQGCASVGGGDRRLRACGARRIQRDVACVGPMRVSSVCGSVFRISRLQRVEWASSPGPSLGTEAREALQEAGLLSYS